MIELGREVQDRITGFKGIAISRTTYLQGCDRIAVLPKVDKNMSYPSQQDFDEPDLKVVGDGALPSESEKPGGPRLVALRNRTSIK